MTQSQNVKRRWHFSRTDEKCQIHRFQKTNKFQAEEIHRNAHLNGLHKEKETWKTNKSLPRRQRGVRGCPQSLVGSAQSPRLPHSSEQEGILPTGTISNTQTASLPRSKATRMVFQTETLPPAESTNRCNSDEESDSRWEIYKRKKIKSKESHEWPQFYRNINSWNSWKIGFNWGELFKTSMMS